MSSKELAFKIADLILQKKGSNIVVMDISKLTTVTDYFVICEAPSERQAQAIAGNIRDELSKLGKKPMGFEGFEQGNWILCDYGDVVVHIFLDSVRSHYNLEGFWHQAPIIPCES